MSLYNRLNSVVKTGMLGTFKIQIGILLKTICKYSLVLKYDYNSDRSISFFPITACSTTKSVCFFFSGMTQHDQEQILECFRQGEYRLLISTSVLEEGLDVPECNFIVRYCKIGNEISTVQTRGKGVMKQ